MVKYAFGFMAIIAIFGLLVASNFRGDGTVIASLQTETATVTNTPTASPTTTGTPIPTATPLPQLVTAPVAGFPISQCTPTATFPFQIATVTFPFQPGAGISTTYVDLSLFDNNFVDGTYLSSGGVSATGTSYTWQGILPGLTHFARATGVTSDGRWVMSATVKFVPCGPPHTLPISYQCTGFGVATVFFNYAPVSPPALFEFVDLSLDNNGFVPGTFIGGGPLQPTQQFHIWPGILVNRTHYWRVNEFNGATWTPSETGTFIAFC